MTPRRARWFLVVSVVALSSLISHGVVWWLGIETRTIHRHQFGADDGSRPSLALGSSLIFRSLDFERIAEDRGGVLHVRSVPSASVSELEFLKGEVEDRGPVIVGISLYDQNERFFCNFRSEIVPFSQTIRDVRESGSDWPFAKRVVSQYPLAMVRVLYPTAGRSNGVMVGIRAKIREWLKRGQAGLGDDVMTLDTEGAGAHAGRITTWSEARTLRNLAKLRNGCRGVHAFDGPKRLALFRILEEAAANEGATLVVIPVSPPYREALVDESMRAEFDSLLAEVQERTPSVQVVRLDRDLGFDDAGLFQDLIHLNRTGQELATDRFLGSTGETGSP